MAPSPLDILVEVVVVEEEEVEAREKVEVAMFRCVQTVARLVKGMIYHGYALA